MNAIDLDIKCEGGGGGGGGGGGVEWGNRVDGCLFLKAFDGSVAFEGYSRAECQHWKYQHLK